MPQSSDELRDYWANKGPYIGHADSNALQHLRDRGIVCNKGVIIIRDIDGQEISAEDRKAIDYLIQDWDYDFKRI